MTTEEGLTKDWFSGVLARHQGPLLRYAGRFLGDAERGRDAVQESFLRLWRECRVSGKAMPDEALAPWLYTVCRNLACDILRKERRMVLLTDEVEAQGGPSLPLANSEAANVMEALERLPTNQREVIRLKFQSGLSYKDIARVTGLSVSNVGFLIHSGIKSMRSSVRAVEPTKALTKRGIK